MKNKTDLVKKLHKETGIGLITSLKILRLFDFDINKSKEYIKTDEFYDNYIIHKM